MQQRLRRQRILTNDLRPKVSTTDPTHTAHRKLTRRRKILITEILPVLLSFTAQAKARVVREEVLDSRTIVTRAMQKFERNLCEEAVLDFDGLIERQPGAKPYLWQRGIALFYAEEFKEAEKQFRMDARVNANDTEEAAWAFLSQMMIEKKDDDRDASAKVARANFVELRGEDSRKVMKEVLELYRTGSEDARENLVALSKKPAVSTLDASDAFYSALYLGLYSEAVLGDRREAKYWMKKASGSPYGVRATGDFMTSVAKVHLLRRGWTDEDDFSTKNNTKQTPSNVEVVSTHAFDQSIRNKENFPFPESKTMMMLIV